MRWGGKGEVEGGGGMRGGGRAGGGGGERENEDFFFSPPWGGEREKMKLKPQLHTDFGSEVLQSSRQVSDVLDCCHQHAMDLPSLLFVSV